MARRGADVTLLEGHGWLLPRQLNRSAGEILAGHVESSGIKLRTKARTREILGDERVRGVLLEDDSTIDTDLLVVATGIRSNSYLARTAGLDVDQGIVVDNLLKTSHPDVFAAGDVAEHRGCVYGTWAPSQYQGSIAGMNAAGALQGEYAQISSEELISANPEIILLADAPFGVTPESVAERPGWDGITAVQNGSIYPIDPNIMSVPGPRLVDALEETAKLVHPELFE